MVTTRLFDKRAVFMYLHVTPTPLASRYLDILGGTFVSPGQFASVLKDIKTRQGKEEFVFV